MDKYIHQLRKEYIIIGKTRINTVFAWFVIGIGVIIIANLILTVQKTVDSRAQELQETVMVQPTSPTSVEPVVLNTPPEEVLAQVRDSYIVTLTGDVQTSSSQEKIDEKVDKVADALLKLPGVKVRHRYKRALKGLSVKIPKESLEKVKQNPQIESVYPDGIAKITAQTVSTGITRMRVDLSEAADIDSINDNPIDVDIAILDTGVDFDHPDLNVVENVNFTSFGNDDVYGHGTHVAGIAGAIDNDFGMVGVAPGARLHAVKVMGDNGWGYWSEIIEGVDWVTTHADTIDVVNMSIVGTGPYYPLRYAIQQSVAKGVVYVVAAGNDSQDIYGPDGTIEYSNDDEIPASYPEVLTVSAMSPTTNVMASFSNFSPSVVANNPVVSSGAAMDVAAPGVGIYSTYKNGGYKKMSGTSMASPHVAGLVGLYIATHERARDAAGVARIRQVIIDQGEAQSEWGVTSTADRDANPEVLSTADVVDSQITLPNMAPNTLILDPTGGQTLSGIYNVKISATDSDGTISKVELNIDNGSPINVPNTLGAAQYTYSWNSASVSDGTHTLKAVSFDDKNLVSNQALITVTTDNVVEAIPTATIVLSKSTITLQARDEIASEPLIKLGTGLFLITRTGDTSSSLPVTYTISGNARANDDYVALTGSATIPQGAVSVEIVVTAKDDKLVEGVESIIMTLVPDESYLVGSRSSATIEIADDELPLVTIYPQTNAAEPSTEGIFALKRRGDTAGPLSVYVKISRGDAVSGVDYQTLPQSFIIPAGYSQATIKVIPKDDSVKEATEKIKLTVTTSSAYQVLTNGTQNASINLYDND